MPVGTARAGYGGGVMAFVFRLLPPRPDFPATMSDAERETMTAHVEYWTGLMREGHVLGFGPVADVREPYGIGIVLADDLAAAERLRDADPAVVAGLGREEISPVLRLVTPSGVYQAG